MESSTVALLLANALTRQMTWDKQCRKLFSEFSITTRLGIQGAIEDIGTKVANDPSFSLRFINRFVPIYKEVLFSGNRTLKIFQQDDLDTFAELWSACSSLEVEESQAKKYFPYFIPEDELEKEDSKPVLVNVENNGCRKFLFFSSVRMITEKRDLFASEFPEGSDISEFILNHSKVTVTDERRRQFLDVVCLNEIDNTIEIRLDTSSAISARSIELVFSEVQESFQSAVKNVVHSSVYRFYFNDVVNLFPAIQHLYDEVGNRVVEIGFITEDSVNLTEKSRNHGDIRETDFHQGGEANCPNIDLYRISSRWTREFDSTRHYECELTLNSNVRECSSPGSMLEYAIISMCPTISDMEYMLSMLKECYET